MNDWKLRLKQARENKELNKSGFAKRVGVSNATVTDWEKGIGEGGIKELSGSSLAKIYEVLGVDLYWLLSGKQPSRQSPSLEASAQLPVDNVNMRPATTVAEVKLLEAPAADTLQWVTSRESALLTDFRMLALREQDMAIETVRSLPRTDRVRPRSDQR